jgi:hypothetical protein
MTDPIKLEAGQALKTVKTPTPATIKASATARDIYMRTLGGLILLALLIGVYVIVIFKKPESADALLSIIGTSMGYVLGSRDRSQPEQK